MPDDEERLRERIIALASQFVRALRLSPDNSHTEERWLEHQPQARGEDLEAGRVEGAPETAQTQKAVVDRRLVHPASP